MADTAFDFIDSAEALQACCERIKGADWVALDTEFIREKTFYPRLCLVQLAVPGYIACIDPLAIDELSPLFALLEDRSLTKVLHACSQDLEIFVQLTGAVPGPVFDTQVAAPLLGLPEQMGYGNFVREMLGVSLDKTQTRTDWSHRPLEQAQLAYAADDVRYLAEIYPNMRDTLDSQGRLGWLQAEFDALEQPDRYRHAPDQAWRRIRGLDRLRPKALSIAQLLANWRERLAQERNLPRNWVLKDDALLDIARMAPDSMARLEKIRSLPVKTRERYGRQILERVREGLQREPEPLPPSKRRDKPSAAEEALADLLQARLRMLADEYRINAASLASRKDLVALVQGEENIAILKGWRREMAGNELLALRDGQRVITVREGRLRVSPVRDASFFLQEG